MGYAYDHDCPFEAFITNLGKYNEGALVGEWVKFPTTAEELQKVFERIGIGSKDDFGHPYEEWFITDYDCYVDGLYEMLGEYENLDELNYLASKLEELDDHDYEHFQAAMQVSDYTGSVKDLINLINNAHMYQMFDEWRKRENRFSDASYYTIHKDGQGTLLDMGHEQNEIVFKQMKKYKEDYPNYIYALTMGLGKTILMATCIFYEFLLAKKYPKDKRFCHNALVFAPDKTVLESLREIMTFDKTKVVPPE